MEQEEPEYVEQKNPETDRKQKPAVTLQKNEAAQGDAQSEAGKQQKPHIPHTSRTPGRQVQF